MRPALRLIKSLVSILAACGVVFAAQYSSFANERDQVQVVAGIEQQGDIFYLRFTLRNSGSTNLRLYNNSLPWVDRPAAVHLRAIALNQRFTPLEQKGRLHNTVGTVTLRPSEEISGAVNLNNRFAKFADILKHGSIAVLWIYAPKSPDSIELRETAGVATVNQQDK